MLDPDRHRQAPDGAKAVPRPSYEQRVVAERDELVAKISRLEDFMEGETYDGMEYTDRKFLRIQLMAMMTYCEALNSRIGRFT